ncbi:hypothetical protein PSY31_23655, partial [Shigella flexneri]|nr:hypothetical protein [Shigella flexneri]
DYGFSKLVPKVPKPIGIGSGPGPIRDTRLFFFPDTSASKFQNFQISIIQDAAEEMTYENIYIA